MMIGRLPTQVTFLLVLLASLLVGCNTPGPEITARISQTSTLTVIPKTDARNPTTTSAAPTHSNTTPPSRSATPTSPTIPQLCSPLAEINLILLPDLVSNPFTPPPVGSDLPHQGVDLSLLDPIGDYALEGHTVQAVLAGEVVAVIQDRFPYGNALIIESRHQVLPPIVSSSLVLPTPLPELLTPINLTCPQPETDGSALPEANKGLITPDALQERSMYILYAHLQSSSDIQMGDQIQCGQPLGLIGASGNALYPHLHIEIRVGPPGIRFSSMAHYDNSATRLEMVNYCTWRVSGLFQLIDPMTILSLDPK